jgi:hypothetical protein
MEAKDFEGALSICKKTVRELDTYWLDAARIGAELSLYLKRHKQAQVFFDIVLKAKALPWAKLGLAQLAYSSDDAAKARGTLEALVSNTSAYADAYDLLARIYFEEGQLAGAGHAAPRRRSDAGQPAAAAETGSLAYFVGEAAESEAMLAKAFRLGFGSRASTCSPCCSGPAGPGTWRERQGHRAILPARNRAGQDSGRLPTVDPDPDRPGLRGDGLERTRPRSSSGSKPWKAGLSTPSSTSSAPATCCRCSGWSARRRSVCPTRRSGCSGRPAGTASPRRRPTCCAPRSAG